VTLAIALAAILTTGISARADGRIFHHTIPKEVDAIDLNTGGPYYAPPIPYGHNSKDSLLAKVCGCIASPFHKLAGLGHGCKACGGCGGKGCGLCGGKGMICGGDGDDSGHGHGFGHGGIGDPGCGPDGCGHFGGLGLGHGKRFNNCGLCGGKGCGICTSTILPSSQGAPGVATTAPAPQPTAQVTPSPQACGVNGCGFKGGHKHHGGGICGHDPGLSCGNCGDPAGGRCFHGPGATCGNCRGGHGLGHGGGTGCGLCGGKGCSNCLGKGHLGHLKGSLYGLLHPHAGEIQYFVGPGGPVPLTPGYVPWVNPVRSPRDFFAFPPFTQ
jgi:hypothetical protein